MDLNSVTPIMQFGAVGFLGVAFLLVMRWMMFSMTKELTGVANAIRTLSLTQLDLHKTLIMHDAQIRGVNPSAGKDLPDSCEKALDEYRKVLAALDGTGEVIKKSIENTPPPPVTRFI